MAKQPNLSNITSPYGSKDVINTNFSEITNAFSNTLSRDGSTPNSMTADFDMNGNDILNADNVSVDSLTIGSVTITELNLSAGLNTWGQIVGDIEDQTDLQTELDLKANVSDLGTAAAEDVGAFEPSGTVATLEATLADVATSGEASDVIVDDTGLINIVGTDVQGVIESIDGLIGSGVNILSVDTRTTLKAVDTNVIKTVYLSETGREGLFAWKTGDYSSQIATDTLEGVYVKATAIASSAGAWVRADAAVLRPEWFGAVGDGTTDDGPAINAALEVGGVGAVIDFQSKVYATAETISVYRDGQKLIGRQSGATFNISPTTTEGTVLKWIGASAGTLCYFGCEVGGSADMSGGGIEGVQFDGNALADKVLHIRSCTFSTFKALKARNPRNNSAAWAMYLDSDVQARSGINCIYRCNFYNMTIAASSASGGMLITGAIDETSGRHPAFNSFHGLHLTHDDGDALRITAADDLLFADVGVSKVAGATGKSVNLVPGASRYVTGLTFIQLHLGTNDGPEFVANASAASSAVHGIAIYGLQGVDLAPTITETGGATIEIVDYLGTVYDPDAATRGAYRKGPPAKVGNYASSDVDTLDYYKERLGNLGILFGGNAVGVTYSVNFYRSTRIGNVINFKAQITLTSKGSSTGAVSIGPMPYAAVDGYALSIYATSLTSGVGDTMLMALAGTGTGITLYKMAAGVATALTNSDITNTSTITVSGIYHTTDAGA